MRFSPTLEAIERAKALSGEGGLLSLSHIAPINRLGRDQAARAQDVIDASEMPQKPMNLGKGVLLGADGTSVVNDAYQQQVEAERQHARDMQDMRNQGRGTTAPASTARGMAEDDALISEMRMLEGALQENPETFSFGEDMAGDAANFIYPRLGAMVQSKTKTDSERGILERLAAISNIERHGLFGGALTKTEKAEWAKQDPLQASSTKDALRRLAARRAILERKQAELRNVYPGSASPGTEGPVGNGAQLDSPPSGAGGMIEDQKVVGGRSYIKIDGQWYEE